MLIKVQLIRYKLQQGMHNSLIRVIESLSHPLPSRLLTREILLSNRGDTSQSSNNLVYVIFIYIF